MSVDFLLGLRNKPLELDEESRAVYRGNTGVALRTGGIRLCAIDVGAQQWLEADRSRCCSGSKSGSASRTTVDCRKAELGQWKLSAITCDSPSFQRLGMPKAKVCHRRRKGGVEVRFW